MDATSFVTIKTRFTCFPPSPPSLPTEVHSSSAVCSFLASHVSVVCIPLLSIGYGTCCQFFCHSCPCFDAMFRSFLFSHWMVSVPIVPPPAPQGMHVALDLPRTPFTIDTCMCMLELCTPSFSLPGSVLLPMGCSARHEGDVGPTSVSSTSATRCGRHPFPRGPLPLSSLGRDRFDVLSTSRSSFCGFLFDWKGLDGDGTQRSSRPGSTPLDARFETLPKRREARAHVLRRRSAKGREETRRNGRKTPKELPRRALVRSMDRGRRVGPARGTEHVLLPARHPSRRLESRRTCACESGQAQQQCDAHPLRLLQHPLLRTGRRTANLRPEPWRGEEKKRPPIRHDAKTKRNGPYEKRHI